MTELERCLHEVESTSHGEASLAGTTIQDTALTLVEAGKATRVKAMCSKWHETCGTTVHFQKCKDTMIR